jgi:hypothetical protein
MKNAVEEATGKPQDQEPIVGITQPGTVILVVWGEETFSPVQYNSFRIGGNSVTVIVQEGESALDAWKRGWALLEQAAEIQFADKLRGFKGRIDRTKRG